MKEDKIQRKLLLSIKQRSNNLINELDTLDPILDYDKILLIRSELTEYLNKLTIKPKLRLLYVNKE